jgi:hypothetical protein
MVQYARRFPIMTHFPRVSRLSPAATATWLDLALSPSSVAAADTPAEKAPNMPPIL